MANICLMEEPGKWSLLLECVRNICREFILLVKLQIFNLHQIKTLLFPMFFGPILLVLGINYFFHIYKTLACLKCFIHSFYKTFRSVSVTLHYQTFVIAWRFPRRKILDHLVLRYPKRVQLKNVLDDISDDEEWTRSNQI